MSTIFPPSTGRRIPAYPLLVALMAVAIGVSAAPAPLYRIYQAKWHLAPIATTLIFAAYVFGALIAVLVAGVISDRVGRKPLLVAAMVAMLGGLAVFMVAGNVAALIAARALHGMAVGTAVVVGSAALLDLRPSQGDRSGHLTGIMLNVGMAVTILSASLLAQFAPYPLVTPYAAVALVDLILLLALLAVPEPHRDRRSVPVRVARPAVPVEISADFRFAALGGMAAWSVMGVNLSLFPAFAAESAHVHSLAFGGVVVASFAAAAAISQAIGGRLQARNAATAGDFGTAAALAVSIVALATHNPVLITVASVLIGLGFGLAFGGSMRFLGGVVPGDRRGEVMSAYYLLVYTAAAAPTILAGWAATNWGLAAVFPWFTAAVILACVIAGSLGLRRPQPVLVLS